MVRHLLGQSGASIGAAWSLPSSPRFVRLGLGTLLLTAAGWLDAVANGAPSPLAALLACALFGSGIWLLVLAVVPSTGPKPMPEASGTRRFGVSALYAALILGAAVTLALGIALALGSSGTTRLYDSDAAAFNHYNADLVLHGRNPYTADANFWDALRRFPSVGATPLRAGRYAGSQFGPSLQQVVADAQNEAAHPALRGPEFAPASLHSYPALSFFAYVPGVWAGLPTTFWTSLAFLIAFLAAAMWGAPRRLWLPLSLVLLGNSILALWTLRGSFEVLALLPALVAWRTLDRHILSPVLLGLACAVKQIVWPLAPVYLAFVWRREGPGAALVRLLIMVPAFLVPNLPFALTTPGAWVSSLLLPMTLPIFPSGAGVVALARAGLLPLWNPWVYASLELVSLAVLVAWIVRSRAIPPAGIGLVLGMLPLYFAWHSIFAYFMALPVLAVAAALPLMKREAAARFDERAPKTAVAAG